VKCRVGAGGRRKSR